jgi:hypothetical protein
MNFDKVEVCFVGNKELIDNIENTKHWERDGYYLELENSENKDNRETILSIWIYDYTEESGKIKFGTLKFGNSFETENDNIRYCWLRVDNKILYNKSCMSTTIESIYYIQDDLGLEFNNITSIDVAMDSNICWFRRIKSAIRNSELVPVILNKAYPNIGQRIYQFRYDLGENRKRYLEDAIYITNKEKDMQFCTYNKSDEIEESGKYYIKDWFKGNSKIFRAEIRVKNKSLNEFCEKHKISQYDLYIRLYDKSLWFDIYHFFSNRLIRFVDASRNQISFLQL